VIALAVGIAVGMGLGDNTKATLITRGLAEMARLGAALGADQHTFAGLAGLGDLVATCSSPLSRNRTFGENLGRGMAFADVTAMTRQTVEGVKSSQSVLELARRHGVEMPITEVMVGVVHDGLEVGQAVILLASRSAQGTTWLPGSATASTDGSSPPLIPSLAGSSAASTQRPSRVIPTGTTSYLSRSIAPSTLPPPMHDTACSGPLPPKMTATRTLRCSLTLLLPSPRT